MRFAFSDDQVAFADAVRDLLGDQCTPDRVRAVWDGREPYARDVWEKLAGMGVVGLTAPESAGGLGMGPLDWVLLFEEAGRVALPAPPLPGGRSAIQSRSSAANTTRLPSGEGRAPRIWDTVSTESLIGYSNLASGPSCCSTSAVKGISVTAPEGISTRRSLPP